MPFPEQLLEQAKHLAKRESKRPRQASLRRAVSTAYYGLFHLLISEATLNWKRSAQRHLVARLFEHGKMQKASEKHRADCDRFIKSKPPLGPLVEQAKHLRQVADTFCRLQQQRHDADYDNAMEWTRLDTLRLIAKVEQAFESWQAIRETEMAQAYLLSLLGGPRGSQSSPMT